MPIEAWDAHNPRNTDGDALADAYVDTLRDILESVPTDQVMAAGVEESAVTAVRAGDPAQVAIEDAAVMLAIASSQFDAVEMRYELLDRLLIGMTNAVLDVDTVAHRIAFDRSPTELQQRIEGREPMGLDEYAHIWHEIASRSP